MKVLKRNGDYQTLSFDKVIYRLEKLAKIHNNFISKLNETDTDIISQEVIKNIYDGVKTSELDEVSARIAISYSTENPQYGELASRIVISNMHKNTSECYSQVCEELFMNGLISKEIYEIVKNNKDIINNSIDNDRDYLFDYFGFKTIERSYLLKDKKGKLIERPQHMWMRVALGIHKNDIKRVLETYDLTSQFYFTHASPTLFNAGTDRPSLSSCYLLSINDSMLGIYKTLSDCAMISKHAGGIGLHISNIRASGSYIKGTNGKSDGIVKMLKVFNETARFANQGSKRNGSFAIYIEPHHADIFEFLELRKNTGDESMRARDLFYALWVSDLFMEKVEKNEDWYLMSEDTNPGLSDTYGTEYSDLYNKYVSEGKFSRKVKARELWQKILVSQIETGMPYMSYKDSVNKKSNQKNIGVIKSSNLCVAPETRILTSEGYVEIKTLENKKVNVWNGKEFSETKIVKTGESKELLKVKFSDGSYLECTPYHKFHLNVNNSVKIYDAKDLKSGMELVNIDFPVIAAEACKENQVYGPIPINKNVSEKIKWILENSIENCENNTIQVNSEKHALDIKLMLQTLGINVEISKETTTINSHDVLKLYNLGYKPKKLNISGAIERKNITVKIVSVIYTGRFSDTYCFNEPKRHMGVFNGVVAGNCNEITLVSNEKEIAVCNICTFSLPKYVEKNSSGNFVYNHRKLSDVVKIATRNMNNVIEHTYYPVPETKTSNMNHRPIAMGIQGLANLFFEMGISFESDEAKVLNKEIMETIQFSGWAASMELAKEYGKTYSTYKGSPISEGIFQHNMWDVEDSELSGRWDWGWLRQEIKKYGVMNSMITALPPTASTSQILGNYESFEPQNSNMFMRSTLSGDFPIINKYLVRDLEKLGMWDINMKNQIIANMGSIQNINNIPKKYKDIYKTIWEIPQKVLLEMSRDRGFFVDQSQSLNVYMAKPTIAKLSSMHFYGWKLGLLTGMYYLRTKSASNAQQFTVTDNSKSQSPEEQLVCSIDNRDACQSCSG